MNSETLMKILLSCSMSFGIILSLYYLVDIAINVIDYLNIPIDVILFVISFVMSSFMIYHIKFTKKGESK